MHAALAEILALDLESGLPIILILVLVLFGGSQLPKLARGLGSAQREFKKGLEEGADDKPAAKPDEVRLTASPAASVGCGARASRASLTG